MRTHTITLAVGTGVTTFGMGLLAAVLPVYAQSLGAGAALVGLLPRPFFSLREWQHCHSRSEEECLERLASPTPNHRVRCVR